MKILNEASSHRAWCLHRSGKAIPVTVHPFGALDDDATEDAAWLYAIGDSITSQLNVIQYLANQFCLDYNIDSFWTEAEVRELVDESIEEIACLQNEHTNCRVADAISDYILTLIEESTSENVMNMTETEVQSVGKKIKQHLNQEYLRVRWGSEYQNITERSGAIYFRTSSTDGYDWYPKIVSFLETLPASRKVKEITIERDQSATGESTVYVNHMPLNDFLLNKPIVIEQIINCNTVKENLYE